MDPSYTGFVLGTHITRSTETTSGWNGLSAVGAELGAAGCIQPQTEGQDPALLPLVVIQPETAAFATRCTQANEVWEPVQPATRSLGGRRASWGSEEFL